MKKIVLVLLVLALSLMLCCCDDSVYVSGIENFHEGVDYMDLAYGLLPKDREFLSDYPYKDGEYYFWAEDDFEGNIFVRLEYTDEIYYEAKNASIEFLDRVYADETVQYTHNGFTFYAYYFWEEKSYGIRFVGYNDIDQTLIFAGYYDCDANAHTRVENSSFETIFDEEFGQYMYSKDHA